MKMTPAANLPMAMFSDAIEEGLELAFGRVRPDADFEEMLTSIRSDGANIDELNDLCEEALLHEHPLEHEDRTKIVVAHRAFNAVLRLDGRGARFRLSHLLRQAEQAGEAENEESQPANDNGAAPELLSANRISSLVLTGVIDGFFVSEGAMDPRIWAAEIGYTRENRYAHWKEWCERAMQSDAAQFAALPEFKQQAIRFTLGVLQALESAAAHFERGFYDE